MSTIVLEKKFNGISPKTACQCLDIILKNANGNEAIEVYYEIKRYFEGCLLTEIKRQYEKHYT